MIGVEFLGIAPGTCTWCGKQKDEVVNFAFADKSFAGAMCWNDLKRALKMKVQTGGTESRAETREAADAAMSETTK